MSTVEVYWERFLELCAEHQPIPLLVAVILGMLVPAFLFRWGRLDPVLDENRWKALPLSEKIICNHNTRKFRQVLFEEGIPDSKVHLYQGNFMIKAVFKFPYNTMSLGLPLGQHILVKGATPEGEQVIKPYTPVSSLIQRGYVDFVIKVYPEGRMSQIMDHLEIGDKLEFKGPRGDFELDQNEKRAVGMIAGGTGITPMYQVASALLGDPNEYTSISLIYANLTEDDILIKKELDELSNYYARFKVFYVLEKPPQNWKGGSGYVTKEMIKKHLPPPGDDILITRCGPPAMNKAMRATLTDLGYTKDMQFEF